MADSTNADLEADGSCLEVEPVDPSAPALVTIEPAVLLSFEAKDGPATVSAGRFAEGLPIDLGDTESGALALPLDASSVPWRAGFELPGGGGSAPWTWRLS